MLLDRCKFLFVLIISYVCINRVMVLDAGLIKEFDDPQTLLKDTKGVFHGMAKDAGLV